MPTREDLKYYQSLPLELKVYKTIDNIREFVREYGVDECYVSFSGGKDSTVLLDSGR
jgi:tRNA(Ile)-lysidine synthase TilS/MesJ